MIPLRDLQRSLTKPHVNRVLIIVNVAVFALMFLSDIGVIQNSFVAGMILALAFGLALKKKREKRYRY